MQVAECWWPEYSGSDLCPGQIADVKFDDAAGRFFLLQLDGEDWTYPMRYDAVLKYADETDRNFYKFHLPDGLLEDPADEEVAVRNPRRRPNNPRVLHNSQNDDIPLPRHNSSTSEEDSSSDEEDHTVYMRTHPQDWKKIGSGRANQARRVEPIPFTGENDLFTPNITEEELEKMKEASGDIRFENVFMWMLPTFGDDQNPIPYFEFIAQRMRNYMIYIMITKKFKPRYYNPKEGQTIQADHVARFYGCHLARMQRGFPSIEATWSTRESLDCIGAVKESMPKDAYIDMYRCMHFSDDWDDDWDEDGETSWDDVFDDPKYEPSPDVERHRRKYEHIEDGFNR